MFKYLTHDDAIHRLARKIDDIILQVHLIHQHALFREALILSIKTHVLGDIRGRYAVPEAGERNRNHSEERADLENIFGTLLSKESIDVLNRPEVLVPMSPHIIRLAHALTLGG